MALCALGLTACPRPAPATPAPTRPPVESTPPLATPEPAPEPEPEPEPVATCATDADCGVGERCARAPDPECAEDTPGTCEPRPTRCTREWRPVCGCDGRTYGNPCTAAAAGTSVREAAECAPPR